MIDLIESCHSEPGFVADLNLKTSGEESQTVTKIGDSSTIFPVFVYN
jgi:hypothetical protein